MVDKGEVDEMIVDIVDENLEKCYEIAIMEHQHINNSNYQI